MDTLIKTILEPNEENQKVNDDTLDKAANILRNGGLVAFPTETVYGLGANALDANAVQKIYEAKGRPSDNPLIIHVTSRSQLQELVKTIPPIADKLMTAFWPGPLTIIMQKSDLVPLETCAGLQTVALRYPADWIAQQLVNRAGPIAAPSANPSGKPSPTKAEHVIGDMNGKIDMIIDGGSTKFGLESTIVDVTGSVPALLRPGGITLEMLQATIGEIKVDSGILFQPSGDFAPRAPGMKYTHYSPNADVTIVSGELDAVTAQINILARQAKEHSENQKIGILATKQTEHAYDKSLFCVLVAGDRDKPETIAANLFDVLRQFDACQADIVFAEAFDETEIGLAIMNRLKKAAGYKEIKT